MTETGAAKRGSRLVAGEKEGSYMGRWIRSPGTGDPRDSWKEKREVWEEWSQDQVLALS